MEQDKQTTQTVDQPENRERTIKFLAVVGFISITIVLAWVVFSAIGNMPRLLSAVTSFSDRDTLPSSLTVHASDDTVRHNQSLVLTWDDVDVDGSFAISYECIAGVGIELRTDMYGQQEVACGTFYTVGDITNLNMTVRSTENSFVDMSYTVAFIPDTDPDTRIETTQMITITNPEVVTIIEDDAAEEPLEEDEDDVSEPDTTPTTEDDSTDETPSGTPDTTPGTVTTQPQYEYVYSLPSSDPQGYTDLAVQLVSIGRIESGQFVPSGTIAPDETGAIRFQVKNTGTRTSNTWSYRAVLPNGQIYNSPTQTALKPNETATISLGFTSPTRLGRHEFAITIDTSRDRDRTNHTLNWALNVR